MLALFSAHAQNVGAEDGGEWRGRSASRGGGRTAGFGASEPRREDIRQATQQQGAKRPSAREFDRSEMREIRRTCLIFVPVTVHATLHAAAVFSRPGVRPALEHGSE